PRGPPLAQSHIISQAHPELWGEPKSAEPVSVLRRAGECQARNPSCLADSSSEDVPPCHVQRGDDTQEMQGSSALAIRSFVTSPQRTSPRLRIAVAEIPQATHNTAGG